MTAAVVLSIVAGVCLAAATLAWRRARRMASHLEELTQSYWQLRYEVEELRLQVQRQSGDGHGSAPRAAPPSAGGFIPLRALKR
jgi:hypothetical protein